MNCELTAVCPLLVPIDAALTLFEGYITLQGIAGAYSSSLWLQLSGVEPGGGSCHGATLVTSQELAQLIEGYEGLLRLRLEEAPSVAAFVTELKHVAECAAATRRSPENPPPAFYSGLVKELDYIGWDKVVRLEPQLSNLAVLIHDAAGRAHEVTIQLPLSYPVAAPQVAVDLPSPMQVQWNARSSSGSSLCSLAGVVQQVEAALQRYQDFFHCLEDLDGRCWILEPIQRPIPRSCTHRRLALGGHAALAFAVDPLAPYALPQQIRFLGAEPVVGPMRRQLQQAVMQGMWSTARLPRENLEACLGICLPFKEPEQADDTSQDNVSAECCICYAYSLEGLSPDVYCSSSNCGKAFHRSCLAEWLRSDTHCRQSFNMLFGECPYCSTNISVQVDDS